MSGKAGPPFQSAFGFRKRVLAGETMIGMAALSGSATLVEIIGFRGFDYVLIDCEHGAGMDMGTLQSLIRAADAGRIPALVRVMRNDVDVISRVLDYGAVGIMAPHVSTAAHAEAVVRAAKYGPAGHRGMCPQTRASRWGGWEDWPGYEAIANDEALVVVIVEDPEGVENIDAIAAVDGVDVMQLGAADLSQAMGLRGAQTDSRLAAARQKAAAAARRCGKRTMNFLPVRGGAAAFEQALADGHTMIQWSADVSCFTEALKELRAVSTQALAARDGRRG